MKKLTLGLAVFFGLALIVTGCSKKAANDASLNTTTGFDSLSTTEDLTQLPQTSGTAQPSGAEALPVEVSPVTQSAASASISDAAMPTAEGTLSHEKQIQTALKNAGLYNGAVDGKIGPGSKRAIIAFQKNNGLKADGKVGAKTWAALEPYLNGAPAASAVDTAGATAQ